MMLDDIACLSDRETWEEGSFALYIDTVRRAKLIANSERRKRAHSRHDYHIIQYRNEMLRLAAIEMANASKAGTRRAYKGDEFFYD